MPLPWNQKVALGLQFSLLSFVSLKISKLLSRLQTYRSSLRVSQIGQEKLGVLRGVQPLVPPSLQTRSCGKHKLPSGPASAGLTSLLSREDVAFPHCSPHQEQFGKAFLDAGKARACKINRPPAAIFFFIPFLFSTVRTFCFFLFFFF